MSFVIFYNWILEPKVMLPKVFWLSWVALKYVENSHLLLKFGMYVTNMIQMLNDKEKPLCSAKISL